LDPEFFPAPSNNTDTNHHDVVPLKLPAGAQVYAAWYAITQRLELWSEYMEKTAFLPVGSEVWAYLQLSKDASKDGNAIEVQIFAAYSSGGTDTPPSRRSASTRRRTMRLSRSKKRRRSKR
jgi:hypothetical protein